MDKSYTDMRGNEAMAKSSGDGSCALDLANTSYEWYKTAAIRSRNSYRASEITLIVISASILVTAAVSPHSAIAPAFLGALVVIVAGMRATFHWQENYLQFSAAREAIEAERRLYCVGSNPYDDPSSMDQRLTISVSRIEQEEMTGWTKIAANRYRA
jgi:hypothetical protein